MKFLSALLYLLLVQQQELLQPCHGFAFSSFLNTKYNENTQPMAIPLSSLLPTLPTKTSRRYSKNKKIIRLHAASSNTDEAQKLLDAASKLRAEIAAMEGKTIQQVEQEALEKKQLQIENEKQQKLKNEQNALKQATNGRFLQIPNTADDMVTQAAGAIERAYANGITRQTIRLALVTQDQWTTNDINEWPGGAQQMYREAGKPLTNSLLQQIDIRPQNQNNYTSSDNDESNNFKNIAFFPPNVTSEDIWDFDGSALHTATSVNGPSCDVKALVFPNTDLKYVQDITTISNQVGPNGLFLLINPFWRNVDSWGFNILAPNAKQKAQQAIFDQGYDETYVFLRFSVRGEDCVALKVYPYDWQLFAYREDDAMPTMETAIRLGSCQEEPTNALFTKLLNDHPEFQQTKNMRQFKKMF